MTREVRDGEEEIPQLLAGSATVPELDLGLDLVDFLADLLKDLARLGPVETDLGSLLLQLDRLHQRGQRGRHVVEQRLAALFAAQRRPAGLLPLLDLVPRRLHRGRVLLFRRPEDVRVAADHLLRDRLNDVCEGEGAFLLGHAGMEHDLQKEVAQLVAEIVEIMARDRVGHFVRLLDRVGRDRREVLLEVPRTAGAGRPQRGHDLEEAGDVAGGLHAVSWSAIGGRVDSITFGAMFCGGAPFAGVRCPRTGRPPPGRALHRNLGVPANEDSAPPPFFGMYLDEPGAGSARTDPLNRREKRGQ
ncbi:hypothetical protein N177_0176 [Lutibaculum baratangense AMV1]|uniref:Uncharacterized protein n=1 Tax=Lutibaculum baratangense AMV1 TaxID=631454 RepID=V4R5H1_9HYPH|nr:hypothetical protein N177_0176 [Lutibaculum baratangense AMV1]